MRSPKWLLVAGASAVIVALGLAILIGSFTGANRQDNTDEVGVGLDRFGALDGPVASKTLDPVDVATDVTVKVARPGDVDAAWVADTRSELLGYDGVKSVAVQFLGDDETAFHLWLVDPRPAWLPPAQIAADVQAIVSEAALIEGDLLAPEVVVGGRVIADHRITELYDSLVNWLALFALVVAVALLRWVDWRRVALLAVAFVGSIYFGSKVVQNTFERFDGSITTTPVLGALAGFAVACVVALRLIHWHEEESLGSKAAPDDNAGASDGADLITRSLLSIINDLILVLGSVVVVLGILWIGGGLIRPLAAVVIGGLVGAAFSAAVVAPGFALVNTSAGGGGNMISELPDGRQLALLPVLGLVAILAILGSFLFRGAGVDLLDHRVLDESDAAHVVGDRLGNGPGDPSDAVVVTGPAEALAPFAEAAAALSDVAWVDTPDRRYTGTGPGDVAVIESLAAVEHLGSRTEPFAVVVPSVPIRSGEGADLISDLAVLTEGNLELTEGANSIQRGSTALVVLAVVLLALVGAGTVFVETENAGFAATSLVLRLLGGAATIGIYRLVNPGGSAGESMAALALVAIFVGLFELEFLNQRLRHGRRATVALGLSALGAAVFVALAAVVIALLALFGSWPTASGFGLAVAVALLIEIVVGFMVLRPLLFGEDAVYHTLARPFRSSLQSVQPGRTGKPVSVDDPQWRRLVNDLLIAEFGLQTDPEAGNLDQVFLDGTPLYRQAAEQHGNLSSAHLRVTGLAPQLRTVETYREAPSGVLSVTVDHPERQLVDQTGTVHGVRKPERRSTMLWVVSPEPGQFRIAESIELGAVSLDEQDPDAASTTFPEVAGVVG